MHMFIFNASASDKSNSYQKYYLVSRCLQSLKLSARSYFVEKSISLHDLC